MPSCTKIEFYEKRGAKKSLIISEWLSSTFINFIKVLGIFGGKSIGYTYFGTTVSLAFAVVGPLATFILSQEMKVTFLLECLCGYLISCDTGMYVY